VANSQGAIASVEKAAKPAEEIKVQGKAAKLAVRAAQSMGKENRTPNEFSSFETRSAPISED
jgi:hypothetical protein